MTLFFHELKRGKISLIIWSSIIAFLLAVCVFIYPEMAEQMGELELSRSTEDYTEFTIRIGIGG